MVNKKRLKVFSFFILLRILSMPALQSQGLKFHGNKESIVQRTTFLIFNKESSPIFRKFIDINFEVMIDDFDTFGYIFHIVDQQNNTVYSLTYTYIDKSSSSFKFNAEGKTNHISLDFVNDSIKSKWISVKLHIDLPTGMSSLAIGGKTMHSRKKLNASTKMRPTLTFGRRENLVDVPSFAIRNLNIYGDKLSFCFPLNESRGNDVHDATGKTLGEVVNPYWLINESYHWKKVLTLTPRSILGSKFSEKQQKILFISKDSLFVYQVGNEKLNSMVYANKMPVQMLLGTNFINETTNKIYAYEINNLPLGNTTIAALDVPTLTWQAVGKAYTSVQLHHHNGFLDKKRDRYLVFGGFGNRRYSNSLLSYNFVSDHWDTLKLNGDNISPRFYTSMASSRQGDFLYIFGGVGNESGDQSVGHNYYNDLYKINLKQQTIKRCWDNYSNEKLVSGEQMILSRDEKYLYVLRYAEYNENTHIQLYSISVANGEMEKLGDSIPFISKSIVSNIALYYNIALQKFYCITQEFDETTRTVKAQVFSLSAPPVNKAAIEFFLIKKKTNFAGVFLIVIVLIFCIIVVLLFLYLNNKQKRGKMISKNEPIILPVQEIPTSISSSSSKYSELVTVRKSTLKSEFNKIYLLGIFTVYGKSGRDITYLFSSKLKQIFLYTLLNSEKEGVSSTMLNNLFWPEKSEDKVRNLKGVTLSNLRKVLTEIEGVELVYDKAYFKIIISEPCYCDYFTLIKSLDLQSLSCDELLSICERGQLLECVKQELFDKYKRDYEEIIFSILPQELSLYYNKKEFKQALRICTILLKLDPLYEPALFYSVYSYNCLKEFEKLFKVYAIFVAEYRNTMGQTYPKSLESLLQDEVYTGI
jgi:two-component SAPR family response regulator